MKIFKYFLLAFLFVSVGAFAQDQAADAKPQGHTNNNKFKQLYDEFATPNMFRTGSGAPGPAYYQQQADYKMDIEIDDEGMQNSIFVATDVALTNLNRIMGRELEVMNMEFIESKFLFCTQFLKI